MKYATKIVFSVVVLSVLGWTQDAEPSTSLLILPDGKLVRFATPQGMQLENENQDLIRYLKKGIGKNAVLTGLYVEPATAEKDTGLLPPRVFQVISFPWSVRDASDEEFAAIRQQGKAYLRDGDSPGLAAIATKAFAGMIGDLGLEMSSPQSAELARGEFFAETTDYLAGYNVLQVSRPSSDAVAYLVNTFAVLKVRSRVVFVLGVESIPVAQEAETVWRLGVERSKKEMVDFLDQTILLNARGSIYPPVDFETFEKWRGSILYIRLLGVRNTWALLISVAAAVVILIRSKRIVDKRKRLLTRASMSALPFVVSLPFAYTQFGASRELYVRAIGPFSFPTGVKHLSVAFTETLLFPLWALVCTVALCLLLVFLEKRDRRTPASAID